VDRLDKIKIGLFWIGLVLGISFVFLFSPVPVETQPWTIPFQDTFISAEPEELNNCIDYIMVPVLQIYSHADKDYVYEVAENICLQTMGKDINQLKIATIVGVETSWRKQEGRGKTGDYGPMQVNQIHHAEFGDKYNTDLAENIRVGIIIYERCGCKYSCYNGGGTAGYAARARRYERKLHGVYK